MDSIGIIAGSGQFPCLVARGARAGGLRVVVCAFLGNDTDAALADEADVYAEVNLGQLSKLIEFFKANGVRRLCLAGAVDKPKALDLKPDFRAIKMIARLAGKSKGDDAILRLLVGELQSEGLDVVRPDELAPGLHSDPGVLGRVRPDAETWQDIRFGWGVAKTVGALDIGQCVVVRSGIVAAVESLEGTDACIARGGRLGGAGCTAVKVVKPGQDKRLDLPSIGAGTIALLAEHKFVCLAFDAGGTLFFDSQAALALADERGIAVVAVPAEDEDFFSRNGAE